MIKIHYPQNTDFLDQYYQCLKIDDISIVNNQLAQIPGISLTLEQLIKSPFDDLLNIAPIISNYLATRPTFKAGFESHFDYSANQPRIANFFMQQGDFNLKTCHYCNIEFINVFNDISDYFNGVDFLNNAGKYELKKVKWISSARASMIIRYRENQKFDCIGTLRIVCPRVQNEALEQLENFDFPNEHNHFTLDHFLPQKTHKFFSLCLYNLVPSCYACNAKFKKDQPFTINKELQKICPTSKSYSLPEKLKFKVMYADKPENTASEDDFVLQWSNEGECKHINKYLKIFKIISRYKFHKNEILDLIQKNTKYPDSQIKEISRKIHMPESKVREMIFGDDLFNPEKSNKPLVKLKRDIAKNIEIQGVL